MKTKYKAWIDNYKGDIYRKCVEVTGEMRKVFPELELVKGLVQIAENLKWYQHCWLRDTDGNIIDPTARQWIGIVEYKEIKEDEPRPIERCFNRQITCSDTCATEYARYLNRSLK